MKQEPKPYSRTLALLMIVGMITMLASAGLAEETGKPALENVTLAEDNASGRADEVFDFPSDHLLHDHSAVVEDAGAFVEWLYWTGVLEDVDTRDMYGFQCTLFQRSLAPGLIGYDNHVAISDVRNSRHPRYSYQTLPEGAKITRGVDQDKGAYWRYQDAQTVLTYWENLDAWNILTQGNISGGHGKNISLDLTLVNDKSDYYLQRPDGIISLSGNDTGSKGMEGRSYYYSHPAMTTKGTLTLEGHKIEVEGDSWFDHQWGGFGNLLPTSAWDWFSLRLDDGSFLTLSNLKDPTLNDLPDLRALSYICPKGNISWWLGRDTGTLRPTRWWRSDLFGFEYPVDWILDTPVGRYALEPYFDEQTMGVGEGQVKYWEGIMRVRAGDHTGKQVGVAYLEMAGYAPIFVKLNNAVS